jgi:hypothetical protein
MWGYSGQVDTQRRFPTPGRDFHACYRTPFPMLVLIRQGVTDRHLADASSGDQEAVSGGRSWARGGSWSTGAFVARSGQPTACCRARAIG